MKTTTIALITTAAVATMGFGYLIYFDSKRRNDPQFRKQLKRERRLAEKAQKSAEKESKESRLQMIERAIVESAVECAKLETPEDKERFFMEQVAKGEELCGQGPDSYDDAVFPFYKALKVYPAPLELMGIYQKTLPEPVFQNISTIAAIEQKANAGASEETPEAAAASATGIDVE